MGESLGNAPGRAGQANSAWHHRSEGRLNAKQVLIFSSVVLQSSSNPAPSLFSCSYRNHNSQRSPIISYTSNRSRFFSLPNPDVPCSQILIESHLFSPDLFLTKSYFQCSLSLNNLSNPRTSPQITHPKFSVEILSISRRNPVILMALYKFPVANPQLISVLAPDTL